MIAIFCCCLGITWIVRETSCHPYRGSSDGVTFTLSSCSVLEYVVFSKLLNKGTGEWVCLSSSDSRAYVPNLLLFGMRTHRGICYHLDLKHFPIAHVVNLRPLVMLFRGCEIFKSNICRMSLKQWEHAFTGYCGTWLHYRSRLHTTMCFCHFVLPWFRLQAVGPTPELQACVNGLLHA